MQYLTIAKLPAPVLAMMASKPDLKDTDIAAMAVGYKLVTALANLSAMLDTTGQPNHLANIRIVQCPWAETEGRIQYVCTHGDSAAAQRQLHISVAARAKAGVPHVRITLGANNIAINPYAAISVPVHGNAVPDLEFWDARITGAAGQVPAVVPLLAFMQTPDKDPQTYVPMAMMRPDIWRSHAWRGVDTPGWKGR
jgi:hypothetical protein